MMLWVYALVAFNCLQNSFVESFEERNAERPNRINSSDHMNNSNEATTQVIIVWQLHGTDNASCITNNEEINCKSLHYAYNETLLHLSNSSTHLVIKLRDKNYKLSSPFKIDAASNDLQYLEISSLFPQTTIEAVSPEAVISISCNWTKSSSCISYSVHLKHLNFENFQSSFPSVLMLFTAKYVEILNCSFSNNNCSAINSLDTPALISWTNFSKNHANGDFNIVHFGSFIGFPNSKLSSGGATAFIFESISKTTVRIENCKFTANSATVKHVLPYIEHSVNDTEYPRLGGGIVFLFMRNSQNNNVSVINSDFIKNRAYSAGGIAVLMESSASFNSILINGCKFKENMVNSTSGAVLFAVWDYSVGNSMSINNCQFRNNIAKFAGGIKFMVDNRKIDTKVSKKQTLYISRSVFCGNYAESGSALHLVHGSLLHQYLIDNVVINNSTFCNHKHFIKQDQSSSNVTSYYGGTILAHRMDMEFTGDSYIVNNNAGCGIFASNANTYVLGKVVFFGNQAAGPGAAMSLNDMSRLVLFPGSHLSFLENYSQDKGGALSIATVGMPDLTYAHNPFCFLQYSKPNLPPSQWNVSRHFFIY